MSSRWKHFWRFRSCNYRVPFTRSHFHKSKLLLRMALPMMSRRWWTAFHVLWNENPTFGVIHMGINFILFWMIWMDTDRHGFTWIENETVLFTLKCTFLLKSVFCLVSGYRRKEASSSRMWWILEYSDLCPSILGLLCCAAHPIRDGFDLPVRNCHIFNSLPRQYRMIRPLLITRVQWKKSCWQW